MTLRQRCPGLNADFAHRRVVATAAEPPSTSSTFCATLLWVPQKTVSRNCKVIHHQIFRLLLLIALLPCSLQAQQSTQRNESLKKSVSYGFVSPNTEDNLSLADAIRKLNSTEETNLIQETRRVGCRARFKPLVMRALGNWSDGAEHSTLFKTSADNLTIRYAVASLGKYARQKAVLYFRQSAAGDARLYVLYPDKHRRNLFVLSRTLDRAGVAFRTLVPLKRITLVYVVDLNNELRERIPAAARALKARVRTLRGRANFLGDADREKAQSLFDVEMKAFETTHPDPPRRCSAIWSAPKGQSGGGAFD
jgi:hypothetical protein